MRVRGGRAPRRRRGEDRRSMGGVMAATASMDDTFGFNTGGGPLNGSGDYTETPPIGSPRPPPPRRRRRVPGRRGGLKPSRGDRAPGKPRSPAAIIGAANNAVASSRGNTARGGGGCRSTRRTTRRTRTRGRTRWGWSPTRTRSRRWARATTSRAGGSGAITATASSEGTGRGRRRPGRRGPSDGGGGAVLREDRGGEVR